MFDMSVKWPNGARVAVMLTFDFDAETLWMARDPENARRPGILSQGSYGAKVGVPKILETLREEGVKATFFVPGWTAETHQDRAEMILEGHEIGHHSYSHGWIDPATPTRRSRRWRRARSAEAQRSAWCPRATAHRPARPAITCSGCCKSTTSSTIPRCSTTSTPTGTPCPTAASGPIELPWHWSLDDAPYALFSHQEPAADLPEQPHPEGIPGRVPGDLPLGRLYNLVMHPQVIGRPSRIALLREMIAFIRTFPHVWIATGAEIATAWSAEYEK